MHEIELQPVGVREEHAVVVLAVLRILGRRFEDLVALGDHPPAKLVDIVATCRAEGEMMPAHAVPIELRAFVRGVRRPDPDAR
ncbi:MAG: hypothetical protein P8R42_10675 [Candidatus Binatia bacterium]|nr:hypothetical protein [Candidatus Binatia bacterium]